MSHIPNPTEDNFPRKGKVSLKDSQVRFDVALGIIISAAPIISPRGITFVSATYTILSTDDIVEATANTFDIDLPTTGLVVGQPHTIKNAGIGTITVDAGGNDIDGDATRDLIQFESLDVYWNGSTWREI